MAVTVKKIMKLKKYIQNVLQFVEISLKLFQETQKPILIISR